MLPACVSPFGYYLISFPPASRFLAQLSDCLTVCLFRLAALNPTDDYRCLDPTVRTTPWTFEEEQKLVQLQGQFGNRWVEVASYLPGRTEKMCKNRWTGRKRRELKRIRALEEASILGSQNIDLMVSSSNGEAVPGSDGNYLHLFLRAETRPSGEQGLHPCMSRWHGHSQFPDAALQSPNVNTGHPYTRQELIAQNPTQQVGDGKTWTEPHVGDTTLRLGDGTSIQCQGYERLLPQIKIDQAGNALIVSVCSV